MAVADVFKVYLYPDPLTGSGIDSYPFEQGEDITSGIVNVDIIQGTDTYEGPQEQIDTGQFTIVTRNPAMDPKINLNLKYNSRIKFYDERSGEFFRGYVTDIQVQYQRNDDPIITITGTDIFGAMQRVVINQDTHDAIMALSTGATWNGITFSEFIQYMTDFSSKYLDMGVNYIGPPGYPTPAGFWFESTQSFAELSVGNLGYSPAKYIPQVGETYLDVINKYAQTNLTSFSAKNTFGDPMSYHYINVADFIKYNPNYWNPISDPYLTYTTYDFSSDPADGKPYETILINNGYNRVINQVDISNEYRYVDAGELKSESESFTRILDESIEDYAISRASISTIYPEDAALPSADWADKYSQNIFQVTAFPGQEIQQITFDNARYEYVQNNFTYSDYALNQMIRIKHEINNNETIDRIYDIAGITHNISPDKWEMGFTLKPSQADLVFINQGSIPTLEMNSLSGNSNFNFIATLVDYDPTTVTSVLWALSATNADSITEIWPYALSGNMFKNNVPRTGSTQTWNFDDDGILAPYSFDTIYVPPDDNRYGGFGSGNWYVYAFITLSNGFTVVLQQELVVGTPVVEADFGWVQNTTNNFGAVQFTDTSVNHEVGENDSYAWTFGDGTTSALANPVKVYDPAPGQTTYSVSLTVFAYGAGGVKVYNTHTETVTLVQPVMTANFTFLVFGNEVTFTNTSTNVGYEEPDAYLWEFGDGQISTEKNPFHVFPAPEESNLNFNVKLTVKNIWEQSSTIIITVTIISVNASGTMSVRYLQLRQGNMYGAVPPFGSSPGNINITPNLSNFKARTSKTKANLAFNKLFANTSSTNASTYEYLGTPITTNTGFNMQRPNVTLTSAFTKTIDLETTTNEINDIITRMNFAAGGNPSAYAELDIFTTLETGPLPNPSTATWFKIGSIETGYFTDSAEVKTLLMSSIRPMPLNIPYFYYTVNHHVVSFTSVETASAYAWTFGDGTTSTLQNPVKTFPRRGTYNVSLAVTNNGVVTRTTTEPVIIKSVVPFATRYIKFVQNEHIGTYAFDTPTLVNFKPIKGPYELPVQAFARTDFQYENYPMDVCAAGFSTQSIIPVTSSTPFGISQTPANMWFSYGGSYSATGYNNTFGIRAKSLDASFRTSWSLVVDLQSNIEEIKDIKVDLRRDQISVGAPYPTATGITYSVYVTNVTGSSINPLTATWTKIGDFVPTNIPAGTLGGTQNTILEAPQTYSIIPS